MMHLPALVLTKQGREFQSIIQNRYSRGIFGEELKP